MSIPPCLKDSGQVNQTPAVCLESLADPLCSGLTGDDCYIDHAAAAESGAEPEEIMADKILACNFREQSVVVPRRQKMDDISEMNATSKAIKLSVVLINLLANVRN